MTCDLAYFLYVATLFVVLLNTVLFSVWIAVSRVYQDKRYSVAGFSLITLNLCFAYVLSFNVYVRYLRDHDHAAYDQFLSSPGWALRYLPIFVYLLYRSIILTRWAIISLLERRLKKKAGEWTERKGD